MPSPLVKENLKATNLAMTLVVPSTSSPVALVRRTYCPTIDTGRNTTAQAGDAPAAATPKLAPIQP